MARCAIVECAAGREIVTDKSTQKDVFAASEGDAWFARNQEAIGSPAHDPVQQVLRGMALTPQSFLEVGCSNGWRVDALARAWRASGFGIDPSQVAIAQGGQKFAGIDLRVGSADSLPFEDGRFDLLIYGFCLYLCDRDDLFRIAAEGDRVLADGGYLVIYDFLVPAPYARVYHHEPSLRSFKMDHACLFTWHPAYSVARSERFDTAGGPPVEDDRTIAVTVLKKDTRRAFPLRA
jgi:SAM-dependent methyltransferase